MKSFSVLLIFCFTIFLVSAQPSSKSEWKNQVDTDQKSGIIEGEINTQLGSKRTILNKDKGSPSVISPSGTDLVKMEFGQFKDVFIETIWKLNPHWASFEGYHAFDHVLELPDNANRFRKMGTYNELLKQLDSFDDSELTASEQTDKAVIKNYLSSTRWYIDSYRSFEWNPSVYNLGGVFDQIASNENKDINKRLEDISLKLLDVPKYYQIAKDNLKNPTIEHTELAAKQILGSLSVFNDQIPKLIVKSSLQPEKQIALNQRLDKAVEAIEGYSFWLEKVKLPEIKKDGSWRTFRLGSDKYNKKFKYDLNTKFTPKQLYDRAVAERGEVHLKMYELAKEIWSDYFPNEAIPEKNLVAVNKLIDVVSSNHVEKEDFLPAIRRQLPKLREFVEKNDLVYLDPDKPLTVRETPAYMDGGGAGASVSSPGAYEKDGETFYNVTPLTSYSDEDAESYLKEYNDYMLQILNIHEAIPGHYTQLVHANESPSLVKSILGNGTMIEGWACYAERMMLEEGYGNDEPEMWLMYYKWLLRIINNTIIDYSIHNLDMEDEQVLNLLVNGSFQEAAEANGKLKRAKLSQVQLCSYYAGLSEILDLRTVYFERNPDKSLRDFHDAFLSYGSAPVKEIRKLMLN